MMVLLQAKPKQVEQELLQRDEENIWEAGEKQLREEVKKLEEAPSPALPAL